MTEILIVLAWSTDMSDTLQPVLTSADKTWRYFLLKYCHDVTKIVATAMAYPIRSVFYCRNISSSTSSNNISIISSQNNYPDAYKDGKGEWVVVLEHLRPKHHCPPELPCNKTMNTFISWKPFGQTKDFLSTSYLY